MSSFLKFHHLLNDQRYTMWLRPEQSMQFNLRDLNGGEHDTRQEVFTAQKDGVSLTVTTVVHDGYDCITTQHELHCAAANLRARSLLQGDFPLWEQVSSTQHTVSTRTQGCQG